ncbi:hypothetical protein GCM10011507_05960 [Edaphobacter acidisoli]|uniref:Aldose 1-epimerase n=1 Tax=Edaphobacter acidisoli TaxID=2040573 RepID=A0A916RI13_9BACT|nr:hypothetical protein [Edaphobacter acidisoli]GGA57409.1 hypothetical protein GCM10011507_05960 [Edaphobacter acidisoli]
MYTNLLRKGLASWRDRVWQGAVRSGILTIVVVILVVVGLAVGWHEHRKGHFARLKAEIRGVPSAPEPQAIRPGGQDVVVLQRSPLPGDAGPEFTSATLLPGRGMSVLQIKAYLPDRGEVDLLASPPLDEAAKLLDDPDKPGAGMTLGAAIEAPWDGQISGAASENGASVTTSWHGHRLVLPNDDNQPGHSAASFGGLLLPVASSEVHATVMPDGGASTARFHADSFDGQWLSKTDVTTMVQLGGRSIEINITARNVGNEAEPIGLGWHPKFQIVSGNREKAMLKLPNSMRVEENARTRLPSGKLLSADGTAYDFTKPEGAPLGTLSLDDTFVHLKPGLLDNGPTIELRDTVSGFGLRITAVTSSIKAVHVYSPAKATYVVIDPAMNYDDPFGGEWGKDEDTGMAVLEPGQSVQWKIRLEIFPLVAAGSGQF